MGSPGIDEWIAKAPESWAKLAEGATKKTSFQLFKKKFFEGARLQNKDWLEKNLTDKQLKEIYLNGVGGELKPVTKYKQTHFEQKKEPVTLIVTRKGKDYSRQSGARWSPNLNFALTQASKTKAGSEEYNKIVKNIMDNTGKTRQAVVKKIQRTRRESK